MWRTATHAASPCSPWRGCVPRCTAITTSTLLRRVPSPLARARRGSRAVISATTLRRQCQSPGRQANVPQGLTLRTPQRVQTQFVSRRAFSPRTPPLHGWIGLGRSRVTTITVGCLEKRTIRAVPARRAAAYQRGTKTCPAARLVPFDRTLAPTERCSFDPPASICSTGASTVPPRPSRGRIRWREARRQRTAATVR